MKGFNGYLIFATIIAIFVTWTMMYVGWEHNSMGEIYSKSGIDCGYLLAIGFSWFVGTLIVFGIIFFLIRMK